MKVSIIDKNGSPINVHDLDEIVNRSLDMIYSEELTGERRNYYEDVITKLHDVKVKDQETVISRYLLTPGYRIKYFTVNNMGLTSAARAEILKLIKQKKKEGSLEISIGEGEQQESITGYWVRL